MADTDQKNNVLITVDVDDQLVAELRERFPQLNVTLRPVETAAEIPPDVWADASVLFTWSVLPDREMAPKLRWVQAASAGVDHMNTNPLFVEDGVLLTTTSGIHAVTMAEHALAMMLALARNMPTMISRQAAHDWPPAKERDDLFMPRLLRLATLGVVGYGSIGREMARLTTALGMNVLATKRDVKHPVSKLAYVIPGTGDADGQLFQRLYPTQALKSMLKECDFVVIFVPKTADTIGLFDVEAFKAMKPGAILVNLSRGGVVDEAALIVALQSGALAGAGFDVFEQEPLPHDDPLWDTPNLIISPHIGGIMPDYVAQAMDVFAENLERYLTRRDLINLVDVQRGY